MTLPSSNNDYHRISGSFAAVFRNLNQTAAVLHAGTHFSSGFRSRITSGVTYIHTLKWSSMRQQSLTDVWGDIIHYDFTSHVNFFLQNENYFRISIIILRCGISQELQSRCHCQQQLNYFEWNEPGICGSFKNFSTLETGAWKANGVAAFPDKFPGMKLYMNDTALEEKAAGRGWLPEVASKPQKCLQT